MDPIPLKTCNWNCVYCQLGRSRPMTDERKIWVPEDVLIREIFAAVEAQSELIDWITFVGSGEPTLHEGLGTVIRAVRARTDLPIAVITNGSLLHLPEVRADLRLAQAVLPNLDAGDAATYRRIDRPLASASFERLVQGLLQFRAEYSGALWVEVMLVRDLNDGEAALASLAEVLTRVRPDQIHLNVPTRSPAEPWVAAPTPARLSRAQAVLQRVAPTIIPAPASAQIPERQPDLAATLLEIVTRHPMSLGELDALLPAHTSEEVRAAIDALSTEGRVAPSLRGAVTTWHAAKSWFPDDGRALRRPENDG